MKFLQTLLLFITPFFLQAQITFDSLDVAIPGETYSFITDTMPEVTPGAGGADMMWSFTELNVHTFSDIVYALPGNTPNGGDFPNSELALDIFGDGSTYLFFDVTSAHMELEGIASDILGTGAPLSLPYSNNQRFYEFPVTYNTTISDDYGFSATVPASLIGIPLADSVRITRTGTITVTTDGYGTLQTTFGDFQTLRNHIVDDYTDEIEALAFGIWTPVPPDVAGFGGPAIEESYEWLAEETKGPIMTMNVEPGTTNVTSIDYANLNTTVVAPVASFTYMDNGSDGIDFTDQSTNMPSSHAWDFGDGTTSNEANPTHIYTQTGTYEVCMTVTNLGGTDTYCETIMVVVAPMASFSNMDGANDGDVSFTDLSTNEPTSWSWDFGDGITSTEQNPMHTYASEDTYTVCLTASNSSGSDTYCADVTVTFTTSIFTPKNEVALEIFPNPADDFVQIKIEENTGHYELVIFDAIGREVSSLDHLRSGDNTVFLQDLSQGNYYFKIINIEDNKSTVKKIMIK